MDNYLPAVPKDLFMHAWSLANNNKKLKGRAIYHEPLEWSGLLYCNNHPGPRKIASLNSKGRYTCQRDYIQEASRRCLDIASRFLDEPLTATVLQQLDFTPFTEQVLSDLESQNDRRKIEESRIRIQARKINEELGKWQALLQSCVDDMTGQADREKESFYWGKIRECQEQLEEIKARPISSDTPEVEYANVREFLENLNRNWNSYSTTSRNQLLKHIIESVEIRGNQDIKATIHWKTGFRQKVTVHRPVSNSNLEKRWTKEEDALLKLMFASSSPGTIMTALGDRTWKAIKLRA